VLAIRDAIGIPHDLKGLGIEDDSRFSAMAEMAVVDPTAGGNPVPLDVAGARAIYEAALAGKVG
jgi:alcohol dehydrogenase class IV